MEIIGNILLNEIIEFNISSDELKKRINDTKSRKFDVKWVSDNEFKFYSEWAIGTINGISIKGNAIINEKKENNKIEVHLNTNLRPEILFCIGLYLFIFIVATIDNTRIPIWFYFLSLVTVLWFWWIFRFQENHLFDKVKGHLSMLNGNG